MKKHVKRLLLFFIAVPAIVAIILLLPHKNHLIINIFSIVFSGLGAGELANILKEREHGISKTQATILGGLGPFAATLSVSFNFSQELIPLAYFLSACFVMTTWIFTGGKKITFICDRVICGFSIILYPGFFMIWLIRIGGLPMSSYIIIVFLLVVFGSDAWAWVTGMLFGKGNRGIIAVSPQKSIAGFIGSYMAAIFFAVTPVFLLPGAFTSPHLPSPLAGVLLGIFTGSAAILGDLAESALKRGSNVKDSGSIIPGRGGVLDSIDSIAIAAPVFYYLYLLLFL